MEGRDSFCTDAKHNRQNALRAGKVVEIYRMRVVERKGYDMETTMMNVRAYREEDIPAMIQIWNEVVEEGVAFPQEDFLEERTGTAFFAEQSYCGVAQRECIFCIRTMWAGADIYATPVMLWLRVAEACISGKSWCWTASNRRGGSGFMFYSSMRLSRQIFMPDICMRESGLHS